MRPRFLSALALTTLLAVPVATQAAPLTIDFNSATPGGFFSLIVGDYQFNYIGFGDLQEVQDLGGGNMALFDSDPNNASGAEVVMSRIDAQAFSVLTFDLVNVGSGGPCFWGNCLHFGGNSYGSGSEGTNVPAGLTNIGAFSFNIISSDFGAGVDWGIDNIVVDFEGQTEPEPVPEPGTIGLIVAGLAVLGRKQIAARFRR